MNIGGRPEGICIEIVANYIWKSREYAYRNVKNMTDTINFKIITMDGVFFSGEVTEIVLPTDAGQIAVLAHHIPMVSTVKEGIAVIKTSTTLGATERKIQIASGVLEVRPHSEVYLLVDSAREI